MCKNLPNELAGHAAQSHGLGSFRQYPCWLWRAKGRSHENRYNVALADCSPFFPAHPSFEIKDTWRIHEQSVVLRFRQRDGRVEVPTEVRPPHAEVMQWDLLGVSILRYHCPECHTAANPPLSDDLHRTEAEGDVRGIIPSKGTSDWGRSTPRVKPRIPGHCDNSQFGGSFSMIHLDERLGKRNSQVSVGHIKRTLDFDPLSAYTPLLPPCLTR